MPQLQLKTTSMVLYTEDERISKELFDHIDVRHAENIYNTLWKYGNDGIIEDYSLKYKGKTYSLYCYYWVERYKTTSGKTKTKDTIKIELNEE